MSATPDQSMPGPDNPYCGPATWIDFPISSDEPVKVALFSQFLASQGVAFEHSRRFISMPSTEIETMMTALATWAFPPQSDDDLRSPESLNATLREIGNTVMATVFADSEPPATANAVGIDLRA